MTQRIGELIKVELTPKEAEFFVAFRIAKIFEIQSARVEVNIHNNQVQNIYIHSKVFEHLTDFC